MSVFYHLLVAVVSVVALAAGWVAVQALARRQSPEVPGDSDLLACRMCGAGGACRCGSKPSGATGTPVTNEERNERAMTRGIQ